MADYNLAFDKERFFSALSLVELIEKETNFSQNLSIPKGSKRPSNSKTREGESNIGGLGESTLHLVLKNYISANRCDQEIKYGKKYIDVFLDGKAYEVQTRNFSSLKSKLACFLPEIPVTIVYPVMREKYICWTDPETGEMTDYRKSPKKESVYNIFSELIYIKDYLRDKNLSFCVFVLASKEQKLLSGRSYDRKKYGAVRLNRIPTELFETEYFENINDFERLVPDRDFTVKELSEFASISPSLSQKTVYCLKNAGVIIEAGQKGREKIYSKIKKENIKKEFMK
ncbi:MAG: hypothetical protein E7621_01550 [Ruminococcaceae bacterium]|nr:hypothetical protein [Oscillospiraceae bacterium]